MAADHSVQMTDLVRVPSWVRVLDVICVLLACLAVVVALSGGFRLRLGAIRIGVTTPWPLLLWSLGVGVVRHVAAPQQPLYREFPLLLAAWARVPAVRVALAALAGTRPIILFVGYLAVFMFGYAEGHAPLRHFTNELLNLPVRSQAELKRARDAYFDELRYHVDSTFAGLIIDKLPLNMLAAPYLYSLFPDARFIFAQRHPCDCVLSCFMQGFAMNDSMACFLDIETAANYYDAAMRLWTRSKDVLPIEVYTLIYEELVAHPEAALRPLVDFLGLDWRDELLDHGSTAKARTGIGTPSYNQVTQPLSRAPSGRWKRYQKQLEPALPILLPWAERLGYND